jgi:hypothetical protein
MAFLGWLARAQEATWNTFRMPFSRAGKFPYARKTGLFDLWRETPLMPFLAPVPRPNGSKSNAVFSCNFMPNWRYVKE